MLEKFKYSFLLVFPLLTIVLTGCSLIGNSMYVQGMQSYDEGKYVSAVSYFTRAIWDDPTNEQLYYLRGNAYSKLNNYEDALKDYTRAIKLNPAKEFYQNRGLTYLALDNYINAAADFSKALKYDPNNSELHFNKGYAEDLAGYNDAAVNDYTIAMNQDLSQ